MPLAPRRATMLSLLAAATVACGGAPPPATSPLGADAAAPLMLRPGDVVRIDVFGHEEVSGEFPVDENHVLLLPMIGEIEVQGASVPDLRRRIRDEFARLYTRSFVSIVPLFRVAILGEVTRPGLYSMDPTMTIYDALATAGGLTQNSRGSAMQLIRGGAAVPAPVDAEWLARATLRELGVRSGDRIVVPRRRITDSQWIIIISLLNTVLIAYTAFR